VKQGAGDSQPAQLAAGKLTAAFTQPAIQTAIFQ